MWKDYSVGYLKNNRSSSIAVTAAALICALCLSFLCSVFYNLWLSDLDNIIQKEGDWQGRITSDLEKEDLAVIRSFPNVDRAMINEERSGDGETTVDLYFQNRRTIFRDMPLIAEQLGLKETEVSYHISMLSRYFIHDPQDESQPRLLSVYLLILVLASLALILVVHNSFAVSMRARIHQFGIFSSIGATPAQIRTCLVQEALVLCLIPIVIGALLGIAISAAAVQAIRAFAGRIIGIYALPFSYHPAIFIISFLSSVLTVLFSAFIPARKLSNVTPLEAIRNTGGLQLKRKKHSRILSMLSGIEGELAGNALKAQKKALRTAALSLTLSFLGFTLILCMFTLSGISTKNTYFERYKDAWDVMVTVKNTAIEDFQLTREIASLEGVVDSAVYQKAAGVTAVSNQWQSEELTALGGLDALSETAKTEDGDFLVNAPIVILDDDSFAAYCQAVGIAPRLDGTIILNRIWDSSNSSFRYPQYIPFVKETRETVVLQNAAQEGHTELPILAYTQKSPVLREEYDNYALVQFVPLSAWSGGLRQIGGAEADLWIRVFAKDRSDPALAEALEDRIVELAEGAYEMESENRIGEKIANDDMILGYLVIVGGLCALLAAIGIANVFSNTLGFLTQRKREFAQYISVGMTPGGIRRMFLIEALVIAGRPLLITLPLTVVFIEYMIAVSHIKRVEFWSVAPFVPIAVFSLSIFGFVALAYYIGGKRILRCDLNEALRHDTVF